MIVGVGIDVCSVRSFRRAMLNNCCRIVDVVRPAETKVRGLARSGRSCRPASPPRKALSKALGAPGNLSWRDAEVVSDDNDRPSMKMRGSVADVPLNSAITGAPVIEPRRQHRHGHRLAERGEQ